MLIKPLAFTSKLQQTEQINAEIDSALENSKEIVQQTIMEQPRVLAKEAVFTVKQFRDELLHRFDLDRLKVRYKTMSEVGRSLERALDNSPMVRRVSNMGIESSFEISRVPTEPNTFHDLRAEVVKLRVAVRNYKELGATLSDVLGAAGGLRETAEEQERITIRLAALALFYREKLISEREARLSGNKRSKDTPKEVRIKALINLDPSGELIEEFANDPSKHTQITEIGTLHGLLTSVAFDSSGGNFEI